MIPYKALLAFGGLIAGAVGAIPWRGSLQALGLGVILVALSELVP